MWAIAGAGYEVVFKGFLLLLAGIPVYVWIRWRDSQTPQPELPSEQDRTPAPVS
jgi:APA family basic amino acid/polyamine antiporter